MQSIPAQSKIHPTSLLYVGMIQLQHDFYGPTLFSVDKFLQGHSTNNFRITEMEARDHCRILATSEFLSFPDVVTISLNAPKSYFDVQRHVVGNVNTPTTRTRGVSVDLRHCLNKLGTRTFHQVVLDYSWMQRKSILLHRKSLMLFLPLHYPVHIQGMVLTLQFSSPPFPLLILFFFQVDTLVTNFHPSYSRPFLWTFVHC
jgi:hypothetical protein